MTEQTAAPTQAPNPPAGEPPAGNLPQAVPHLQNKPAETEPPKPGPPPAKDDKADNANEPLGENGLKALKAERARNDELEKRLKKLAPLERIAAALGDGDADKGKSEIEQITERYTQLEEDVRTERMERWKLEAIQHAELPKEWVDRLRGTTRDELFADADSLKALLPAKPQSQFQGSGDGGVRDQGVQKPQLSRADLKGMSSAQIEAARKDGRLSDLMSGKQ